MRSWGMNICSGLSSDSISFSAFQQGEAIICCAHDVFRLSFDKDTSILVLSYVKSSIWLSILKEIIQFLIVNLQKGAVNRKRSAFVLGHHLIYSLKQVLYRSWDYAVLLLFTQEWVTSLWSKTASQTSHRILMACVVVPVRTKHCESFSRSSLAVCKYRWIESMKHICYIILYKSKKLRLLWVLIENFIILWLNKMLSVGNTNSL